MCFRSSGTVLAPTAGDEPDESTRLFSAPLDRGRLDRGRAAAVARAECSSEPGSRRPALATTFHDRTVEPPGQ
jgi:hypothetical protein